MTLNADCSLWDQMQFHLNYSGSQMQRLKWTTIWSCDDDPDDDDDCYDEDCDDDLDDDDVDCDDDPPSFRIIIIISHGRSHTVPPTT